ncbi:MAG: hypothetical protein KJ709_09380 [Nanoarchaeota archaeon]|nr:hypothetical protein [Nanoarchaeota archaeon]
MGLKMLKGLQGSMDEEKDRAESELQRRIDVLKWDLSFINNKNIKRIKEAELNRCVHTLEKIGGIKDGERQIQEERIRIILPNM